MEASGTATGTSRKKTAFYARKEDLPEELRLKFEEWQNRSSQRHPLYEREAGSYGKVPRGVEVVYKPPEFRKAGNFSKHFLKVSGDRRTTLDTSITKKSFRD